MRHTCHWPGCEVPVPPAMWGCKPHWFSLPKPLRARIWATYRRGQEITRDPSSEYIAAALDVQTWIREYRAGCGAKGLPLAVRPKKRKAA